MSQTVRVSNLPEPTTEQDIGYWFEIHLKRRRGNGPVVCKVGQPCSQSGRPLKIATVTFWSPALAKDALKLFVAVHGLDGHPWNSFIARSSDRKGTMETMWLRDIFPEILEEQGIYPRIMTFGFNANVWVDNSTQTTEEAAENLVGSLNAERASDPSRPLYFFGHSLGGLVVKQAACNVVNVGIGVDASFESPIKGCFFFGVPHKGSGLADPYGNMLMTMKTVLLGGGPNPNMVKDLRQKGNTVSRISMEFNSVRRIHGIKTINCYEQRTINGHKVVEKDSAILDWPDTVGSFGLDADHRDIVKFSGTSHPGFQPIMSAVIDIVRSAMAQPHTPTPIVPSGLVLPEDGPQEELALSNLRRFDTIFLVDDSGSMRGPRWRETAQALKEVAKRAVKYDRNGVDIRFLNSTWENRDNLANVSDVAEVFARVIPDGATPTGDALDTELCDYMVKYRADRRTKKLNLIVLTGGAPECPQEVEDAIVKFAKELESLHAAKSQVGVQFVQVGDDPEATTFLKSLDDSLQSKYGLDRDVKTHPPSNDLGISRTNHI
ncbi:hypothetical protein FGG08_000526 [Glutinoglossum americanum]|uniref:VWFA domain-containing protein n=1 Tax=Glutinoglossum americanum TaxID=1670608 RepID=A0A9P8L5Y6_9PEZI|nr:hypothetical protein FGG08_000526 [Glutinoglossum americanum]